MTVRHLAALLFVVLFVGGCSCGSPDVETGDPDPIVASCQDGVKNADESDVDCGGSCSDCSSGGGCTAPEDCDSGVCTANVCAAPVCTDAVQNGDETEVDCGGGTCADCSTGGGCANPSDCVSGVCNGNLCAAATCADGVKNGTESDVDCGGASCADCSMGGGCTDPSDCASGVCTNGVCAAPTCTDAVQNGAETDVDCGGDSCADCSTGGGCSAPSDCASGVCTGNVCVAPTCADSVANGDETDVDCGGGTCADCSTGGGCADPSDCASGVCTGNICAAASCTDAVQNGVETDVDCGGGTCADCNTGGGCADPSDCTSGVCTANFCVAPTCTDSVKNGDETDVDCGGSCGDCADGNLCTIAGDCSSGVCASGVCASPTCVDLAQNGDETDVDCGGACPSCGSGGSCTVGADCSSGICTDGSCAVASCTDGVKNGAETDVDCGGGTCADCDTGGGCATPSDCASGVCTGNLCAAPTCTDTVLNGSETDVDCGGTCGACDDGESCSGPIDCTSGVCTSDVCAPPSCTDAVRNGNETDVDCGGTCGACDSGGSCTVDGDCSSGICTGNVCAAANCSDGVENGDETDVDCGGGTCEACATAGGCAAGSDCVSGVCTGGVCAAPTCADAVHNQDESDVDCGGSCSDCSTGGGCTSGADCTSAVCTAGVCAAPSCTDSVKNGSETGVDCGGSSCSACSNGGTCEAETDCASGFCSDDTCAACTTDAQCAMGYECTGGACVPDLLSPTVHSAVSRSSTVVRLRFSEAVWMTSGAEGALSPANYCFEVYDGDTTTCLPTTDFTVSSVASVLADTVDITLSSVSLARNYTVIVQNVEDLAGNVIGAPAHADFSGVQRLTIVGATPVSVTEINISFSRPVLGAGVGAAACSTPAECANKFRLIGPRDLGAITSVLVRAAPRDNEVLLTHVTPQDGATYTVIGANGLDNDGFDDASPGAIKSADGALSLSASPGDRSSLVGGGEPIMTFGDGPIAADPFGDGSAFSYIFEYGSKIHLGPRGNGKGAVRMNADGTQSQDLAFALEKDVNSAGVTSSNSQAGPFPSSGFGACTKNTLDCGPDNEDGRGLFTSGVIGGQEWLVIGASRSSGPLSYIYMGRDTDLTLNLKYVDLSVNRTGNAQTFSAMSVVSGRTYLGWPDSGPKRPVLLNLLRAPASNLPGLDAVGNGTGSVACDPAVHDSCNLMAHMMPGIGRSGTPANSASIQAIDVFGHFGDRLYVGNNGGIVRSTTALPNDYGNSPSHWTAATPAATAYSALTSITLSKMRDIIPAERAIPQMTTHNGRLYFGRNTTSGPQLWRCDPATVSGPAPFTAVDCDPGDWSLVAANTSGSALLSQFNNPNNVSLSMVTTNGASLYVGFDNGVDGIVVFKSDVAAPSSLSDFQGEGGCVAGTAGCAGLGGNGFGSPLVNTKIFDSLSLTYGGSTFLYTATGTGTTPVRVYRNLN